jgi:O-glycosyl hydrolase
LPPPSPPPRPQYTQTLGLDRLDAIHALQPDKFILATEACFLDSLAFNWQTTGFLYAADIIGDLRHHVGGWVAWNTLLLAGDKFPESYGGPNHDNTTRFGDGILLEFNATGTQRLIFQSAYWIQGHFSRFMRPGSFVVLTTGDITAQSYADFESVRKFAVGCRGSSCPPPAAQLPLMSVGYVDPVQQVAGVVVANVNGEAVSFNLVDAAGNQHTPCTIPPSSIQTYTWATSN